jgi:hypothetical protein
MTGQNSFETSAAQGEASNKPRTTDLKTCKIGIAAESGEKNPSKINDLKSLGRDSDSDFNVLPGWQQANGDA